MEKGSMTFRSRLSAAAVDANSLLCVGLDPDLSRMPEHLRRLRPEEAIVAFNKEIIALTQDLVCAYKPNLGFYVGYGLEGLRALIRTRELVPEHIPVILDCKVGDIDSTAVAYARGYFDEWQFDAVTANPYLGEDSLVPFLQAEGRGVIVICKTSNPGSGDFQDLDLAAASGAPLYLRVSQQAAEWEQRYPASVGLVVGATYPDQLAAVRSQCPDLPILLPGVGAQAGDLEASLEAGLDSQGGGLIVSASRGVIYAGTGEDFAEQSRLAAETLRDRINANRMHSTHAE
jgi:orotidine-5'-phosphate decarboxylase